MRWIQWCPPICHSYSDCGAMVQIGSDFRNFQPFLYPLISHLQLQLERRVEGIYRPNWCAEFIRALGFVICLLVVMLWLKSAPIFAIFDLLTYGNLVYFSGILLSPRSFGRHRWYHCSTSMAFCYSFVNLISMRQNLQRWLRNVRTFLRIIIE